MSSETKNPVDDATEMSRMGCEKSKKRGAVVDGVDESSWLIGMYRTAVALAYRKNEYRLEKYNEKD